MIDMRSMAAAQGAGELFRLRQNRQLMRGGRA